MINERIAIVLPGATCRPRTETFAILIHSTDWCKPRQEEVLNHLCYRVENDPLENALFGWHEDPLTHVSFRSEGNAQIDNLSSKHLINDNI